MSYLSVRDLNTHFGKVRAVDGVSFDVERGEILGLVGESGCGKSTLARTLMQLEPLTSGSIVLDGVDFASLSPGELRRRRLDFQMIFQDPYASLNPRHTVFSTLSEAVRTRRPELSGEELTAEIAALMERCGMNPAAMRKYPHEFSGGQRQRIAIARALAPQPKLLIADEPVSALDVSIQSQILNLLRALVDDLNLTMIFVSHDLSVVRYLSDRIAVMLAGKLVEIGLAEQVFNAPQHEYTKSLLTAVPTIDPAAIHARLSVSG